MDSLQDMQYARMKTMQEQFQTNLKVSCGVIIVIGPPSLLLLSGVVFVSTVVYSRGCLDFFSKCSTIGMILHQ